jgi:C-terminal processing protease CtpA/Prc
VTSAEAFHIPTGLCRKQPKSNYWYEYLGDTATIYIQYNRCRDEPGHPFGDFARGLFAFADSQPVERVIVDLRFNGGGDNGIVRPLVDGLSARPALNASGHLFALTDGATFSAGMWAAHGLRKGPHAILVGQAPGNTLNHYGLMDTFKLPNSKLSVNYSRKRFRLNPGPEPSSLTPDTTVPYALADFLAGRDPALNTALHRPLP